ncbi:hypothetical protein KIN20_010746 [Parelaphostrongylus tenuis]|uniref:Tudor domain-containing protein n=1 Tax=Parelaphostrongylus tenuis TaxID=148309 RepID=A0AAD5MBX2_PARTN|nr:hypothetical protein KIN20_010746 [Parelaphostrongylus tenuis]
MMDSQCRQDQACLIRFKNVVARAKIVHGGIHDLQVFLIDYGRSMFIKWSDCFAIPHHIANFAPPLAHYCTLNDADNCAFDNASVQEFCRKLLSAEHFLLRGLGESKKTHGELVEIIDATLRPARAHFPTDYERRVFE